jgi:hypothetical protein
LRTGNLSALSQREWEGIRERRAFEIEYEEKQRLKADKLEYAKYLAGLDEEQRRTPSAYKIKTIPFETWRIFADASISDPVVRGAAATNKALLSTALKHEADEEQAERQKAREAVSAGKRDPKWKLPESAKGLRMSKEKLSAFMERESSAFCEHNPEYFPTTRNLEAISAYIADQGIGIPDESCFRQAWLRLRELGLIEERPAPAPVPEPIAALVIEQALAPTEPELTAGYDPETGEPRNFTQREIWNMDSITFKKAFRMWTDRDGTDRRAKFINPYI